MPIALWCVLVATVLSIVYVGIAKAKDPRYDNRSLCAQLTQQTGVAGRAAAAQQNHFEAFSFFAAVVLVAILGGGIIDRINLLAIAFIVVRVLYTACYLANWTPLRSLMWFAGFALCVALFVQPTFAH